MAKRTASAKKQARSGARRAARNRGARSEVKTLIVKARRSLADTQAEGSERIQSTVDAVRALDRAASKRVVHPNNAARRKSRLARQLARLASAAPAPAKGGGAQAKSGAAQAKSKKAAPAKAAPAKKK